MLYLNEKAIINSADLNSIMDVIEKSMVFAEKEDFAMPLRSNVVFGGDNSLMLMPCLTPDVWGCKLLTLRPENPAKGYPFLNGMVVLFDANTGEAMAVLEGKTVTALRTGAVAGAGIRHTAKKGVTSLGLVGTGFQGFWQAQYGCAACGTIKEVWIYDKIKDKLSDFAEKLGEAIPHTEIKIAKDTVELLEKTQVVMTATQATEPLFPNDAKLLYGHAFSGIGSYLPHMKEYPDAIFEVAGDHVYVDTLHALDETGDLIWPLKNGALKRENIHTLAERIEGTCSTEQPETSFYKSVGMALFDIICAEHLCKLARETGNGTELDS